MINEICYVHVVMVRQTHKVRSKEASTCIRTIANMKMRQSSCIPLVHCLFDYILGFVTSCLLLCAVKKKATFFLLGLSYLLVN